MSEIKKALKGMNTGKVRGADGLSNDLFKDAGNFLLEKLAVHFIKYLQNCTVPSTWKNAIIILIFKKMRP